MKCSHSRFMCMERKSRWWRSTAVLPDRNWIKNKGMIKVKWILLTVWLTFALGAYTLEAQVQRIESEFWWSWMKRLELQIMFYGEDLAGYDVDIPVLVIENVIRTENPNYLFVTVNTLE